METTKKMKQSQDPFESAIEDEEHESPPDPSSPALTDAPTADGDDETNLRWSENAAPSAGKTREEEDEEDEENMEVELGKLHSGDHDKIDKMPAFLSQLTEEQMSRYESFRRSGFQKATMRRLLQSIAGCPISMPMTIVMSGIAKMFIGELVETAREVMTERKESGPIRPCHTREAYRRLKLEGKVPRRSRPRLFR